SGERSPVRTVARPALRVVFRWPLALPFFLFRPELLLQLAYLVQIRPDTIQHLAALAQDFLDVRMGGRRFALGRRVHFCGSLSESWKMSIRIDDPFCARIDSR